MQEITEKRMEALWNRTRGRKEFVSPEAENQLMLLPCDVLLLP